MSSSPNTMYLMGAMTYRLGPMTWADATVADRAR
jgi:hypothetical protein